MEKKYLKTAFEQNQAAIEKVVTAKISILRSEIEALTNHVFMVFEELCVVEQNLILASEEVNDEGKKFNFAYWFLMLIVPTIYFIDLLLSQDAIGYLLPSSLENGTKTFFCYVVPALFVIADLGIGLVRHKMKTNAEEDIFNNTNSIHFINAFGFVFCLILPMLVGATILAFTESSDIASSEVTARIALMLLSFILHYFVIFLFPKQAFDYCIGYSKYNRSRKKVEQKEQEMYKKLSELSIAVFNCKAKSDQYDFVPNIDKIEFSFFNRLLINQIAKTDAWVQQVDANENLQHIINDNALLGRFFPYRPVPVPAPVSVFKTEAEIPVLKTVQPRGIYITYIQNDTAFDALAN